MIQKAVACSSLVLVASIGFCQVLTASEVEVDQAFKNLRNASQALFRQQGNDYLGANVTPFASDLFFNRPVLSTAQDLRMELVESKNGIFTHRVVADGRHVWGIDPIKNTYSVARYGSYTATRPADYDQNGFQSLNIMTAEQSVWLARLAREVWAGTTALYRPWVPASSNRSETTVQGVGMTVPDPVVNTRVYASSDTKKFHIYWVTKAGTPTRSLTFELDLNGATSSWDLTAIYYSDRSRVGTLNRLMDWKADIYSGVSLPATGNYTFTPPIGARAVASPRPNGAG